MARVYKEWSRVVSGVLPFCSRGVCICGEHAILTHLNIQALSHLIMTKPMTRTVVAAGVAALLLAVAAGAFTTYAHGPSGDFSPEERQEREAQHEAVKEAFSNNDFEAWSSLMVDRPRAEELMTQEHFEAMLQVHELMEAGDKEAAQELLKENGIEMRKNGIRSGSFDPEKREEMTAILESGDFEAWLELSSDHPMIAEHVTEENFNLRVQAHELRQAGDNEGARELLEEGGMNLQRHGQRMFGGQGR